MKSRWETYQGKRFFLCDYTNFEMNLEELKKEIDDTDKVIVQEPKGSVLSLADVTNTVGTKEAVDYLKISTARTKPYVRKLAVLGVSGIRKLMADSVARISGQPMRLFDDVQSAKNWLVED